MGWGRGDKVQWEMQFGEGTEEHWSESRPRVLSRARSETSSSYSSQFLKCRVLTKLVFFFTHVKSKMGALIGR